MQASSEATLPSSPAPEAVLEELERMAHSPGFRKAERCLRLLRYITTLTLEGRSGEIKEYTLGLSVFDRSASYDPRVDPVVRLEARRLRLKLAEYYQQEGKNDAVVIELPKGGYTPRFHKKQVSEIQGEVEAGGASGVGRNRNRVTFLVAVGLGALCLILMAFIWFTTRPHPPAIPIRASIAVLGFRDATPGNQATWIPAALSELMNLDLGKEQRLRVVPLGNVIQMRTELPLKQDSTYSSQLLRRVGTYLGADYVLGGSVQMLADRVHVQAFLSETRSGAQLAAISEDASSDQVEELAERCAARIRSQLGVRGVSASPRAIEPKAIEPYAQGMSSLRMGDAIEARNYLERATSEAPTDPLIRSGLAEAYSALGLETRAAEEAKRAFQASSGLGRVEQLEIEGLYRTQSHDWTGATQVYQALFTLFPDDLEYGLQLAKVEANGGRGQDALELIRTLRKLPSSLGDDPRVDIAEARAAGTLSDFAHTRQAAAAAAAKAKAQGAKLQYARARLLESGAMQNFGIPGFAEARTEARSICAELGDRACVAAAFRIEANDRIAHNQISAARESYKAVLEIASQMGNFPERLNALAGLGYAANLQGDLTAAEHYYREALAVGSEMGAQKRYPILLDLADLLMSQAHLAEAKTNAEEALQLARQVSEQEGIGLSRTALAKILVFEDRASDALAEYDQGLQVLRKVNEPLPLCQAMIEVGNLQLERGGLAAARKNIEEAQQVLKGFPAVLRPELQLAIARLLLAESHFSEAAAAARSAMDSFQSAGRAGDSLDARAVLALSLLGLQNMPEAANAVLNAPAPDAAKFRVETVLRFDIARCLVLARMGRRAEAIQATHALVENGAFSRAPRLRREALQAQQAVLALVKN